MAFAKPLVISYASVDKTLEQINQDQYGTEYLLRESTQEFRVKIRHSRENATKGGVKMDRHNVDLTRTVFGTGTDPDIVEQVYIVFRNEARADVAVSAELGAALTALMVEARFADLGAWLS
nr:MAG: putative coat protein [Leviviridae sp.]